MVRFIEVPEPLFEADVSSRWDRENDEDRFHCAIRVSGKYVVFERSYTVEPGVRDEDEMKDDFLAEFAARFKALLGSA